MNLVTINIYTYMLPVAVSMQWQNAVAYTQCQSQHSCSWYIHVHPVEFSKFQTPIQNLLDGGQYIRIRSVGKYQYNHNIIYNIYYIIFIYIYIYLSYINLINIYYIFIHLLLNTAISMNKYSRVPNKRRPRLFFSKKFSLGYTHMLIKF